MPDARAEILMNSPLAIYIHWPFCQSKCPYCDFNSFVAGSIDHAAWRSAYRRELEHYAALMPDRRITSIFFGGGTPSLMEAETVAAALDAIARLWPVEKDAEVTLEANPGSSEAVKFASFRAAGVNRLSLGVQALRDEDLLFLGRAHSVKEARRAVDLAQKHFPRFSFDLIYARRGQSPGAWETELREALALAGGHLSLYQLTIEPNTAFHTRASRGEELIAEDDSSVAMYELTQRVMKEAGRPAYEVSSHARAGEESRHNLTYWRYEDYIGIGPGAHGRFVVGATAPRQATDNHRAPDVWLREIEAKGNGLRHTEELNTQAAMREALMMGLRLAEGIDLASWREKFGVEIEAFLPPEKIRRLRQEAFIEHDSAALRATSSGLQRLNAILAYLSK
jgi:putative oxygen-independent coproporphyrinogen III oxidase